MIRILWFPTLLLAIGIIAGCIMLNRLYFIQNEYHIDNVNYSGTEIKILRDGINKTRFHYLEMTEAGMDTSEIVTEMNGMVDRYVSYYHHLCLDGLLNNGFNDPVELPEITIPIENRKLNKLKMVRGVIHKDTDDGKIPYQFMCRFPLNNAGYFKISVFVGNKTFFERVKTSFLTFL